MYMSQPHILTKTYNSTQFSGRRGTTSAAALVVLVLVVVVLVLLPSNGDSPNSLPRLQVHRL